MAVGYTHTPLSTLKTLCVCERQGLWIPEGLDSFFTACSRISDHYLILSWMESGMTMNKAKSSLGYLIQNTFSKEGAMQKGPLGHHGFRSCRSNHHFDGSINK